MPTLADLGYDGAGIDVHIPARQSVGGRWRTLQRITASPGKIGDIARAAVVSTHFDRGYIT